MTRIKGKASVVALLIFNAALLTAILSHLLFNMPAGLASRPAQVTAVAAPIIVEPDTAAELDPEQVLCLAMNVYFEARGESLTGKLAVAQVTMNRVNSSDKPVTVCSVIRENRQFSWYKKSQVPTVVLYSRQGEVIEQNLEAWAQSQMVAVTVMTMKTRDVTQGATHFYNPDKARPKWRKSFPVVAQIGRHLFLRDNTSI